MSKRRPVGKVGPCETCGFPDCEYITNRYQACPQCDGKLRPTYSLPDTTWDLAEWEPDAKTPVTQCNHPSTITIRGFTMCMKCNSWWKV